VPTVKETKEKSEFWNKVKGDKDAKIKKPGKEKVRDLETKDGEARAQTAAEKKEAADAEKKVGVRAENLVKKFEGLITEATEKSRVSAAHTATTGWQKLYAAHRQSVKKVRDSLADRLIAAARLFESGEADETTEKEIGAIKADAVALRDRCETFDDETVQPVREPFTKVTNLIDEAIRSAESEARASGMFAKDLAAKMRNAIAQPPKVTWDEKTGVLLVHD